MIDSITRSYIRDAVIEDLSENVNSESKRNRFCGLIMKGHGFHDSRRVLENLREAQEPHYFELRESGLCPEEALEAVLANPWTLQDEGVQEKIVEEFLKDLTNDLATESQIERYCNLIRRGHKVRDAGQIVTELSIEQEKRLLEVLAKGCEPDDAWEYVTTHDPHENEAYY